MFLTANMALAFRIYAQNEFRNLGERGILSYLCKASHCNSVLTTFIPLSENWLWTPVSRKKHESIPPPRSIVWKLAIKWQKLNLWHTVPGESISSLYSLQSHLRPITIVCIIFYLGRKMPVPLFPTTLLFLNNYLIFSKVEARAKSLVQRNECTEVCRNSVYLV